MTQERTQEQTQKLTLTQRLDAYEKLMRLEKTPYFEAMLYPSESHGFTRPSSWTDEYERIFAFFEKHLKN